MYKSMLISQVKILVQEVPARNNAGHGKKGGPYPREVSKWLLMSLTRIKQIIVRQTTLFQIA
jgi:hypothetical protein